MSNNFSRNQMLKAAGAFVAGAAAAKTLPLLGDSPAQAQPTGCSSSLCVSNSGLDFNKPQLLVDASTVHEFARIRFKSAVHFSIWDIAVGGDLNRMHFFNHHKGNVMVLDVGGNLTLTGGLNEGSSRQLKENITELSTQEALETLKDLSPIKFKYKADTEKAQHIGFIAEDVPELVATPDRKGLSAMDFVGVLTKVVQEQQQTLQEQQQTILALAEKVKTLEEKAVS